MTKIKWQNLNNREKMLITFGSGFAIIIIFSLYFIQPFFNSYHQLQQKVNHQQQLLIELQESIPTIQTLRQITPKGTTVAPDALLSTLAEAIKIGGFQAAAQQLRQSNQDQVNVNFKAIPFDQFADWLSDLWQTYHIQAREVSLKPTATAGIVDITITFSV